MVKKVTRSTHIGDQAIALIHRRVSEMGYVWHPRGIDAGIDGEIELRDPLTGAVLNHVLFVQSKGKNEPFSGETDKRFHYLCDQRDIDYWMAASVPVLLVCSHPNAQDAWWVHIQPLFSDPTRRATRRVEFDKETQRFDKTAAPRLLNLGDPAGRSHVPGPERQVEHLVSNLLPVTRMPAKIFSAPTDTRDPRDVFQEFREQEVEMRFDWLLREGRLHSFSDLGASPLARLCRLPATATPTQDWAFTDDPLLERKFVELLNCTVRQQTNKYLDWYKNRNRRYLYFRASGDLTASTIRSFSGHRRTVFKAYLNSSQDKVRYYRHDALRSQFVRIEDQWYLELAPTYHFTWDGRNESNWAGEYLKGIKRLEHNPAVRNSMKMWAAFLRGEDTLLERRDHSLEFGQLLTFRVECGINDQAWLKQPTHAGPGDDDRYPTLFEAS